MLPLHVITLLLVTPAAMKCPGPATQMPGYEWREPVLLVDAVVMRPDSGGIDLQPEEIAWLGITCWDPETDSFERDGIPVIRIQTKALIAATRAPLLRLIRAQQDFRSRHGRYATGLESLEAFGLDTELDLDFEASHSGWKASTPSGEVAYQCSADEASAATLGEDREPQLDCARVDTLALRSLRTLYNAGR